MSATTMLLPIDNVKSANAAQTTDCYFEESSKQCLLVKIALRVQLMYFFLNRRTHYLCVCWNPLCRRPPFSRVVMHSGFIEPAITSFTQDSHRPTNDLLFAAPHPASRRSSYPDNACRRVRSDNHSERQHALHGSCAIHALDSK